MNKMNILSIKIENERAYMISLAEKYGYTSEVVLKISQELDKLIHQYQNELLKKTK
ncbi:aspartyl-phosphate phosphatase Spo0E family protein [Aeribacillus sp. FSL M8-0254]|uniref:aspartyl-phosphate phosphatase Spo0E family protein n=1 Tax=Aeribacillus sp. FSL M8-0254 TaxID=2954577 RepID=UPI0030FC9817